MSKKSKKKTLARTRTTKKPAARGKGKKSPTVGKIVALAESVAVTAAKKRDPAFQIPLRTLSNARFNKRKGIIELGLHFEGEPESNFRHLELLQSLSPQIHEALGDEFEIEEWDRGWTRAYEAISLEPLTDDFLVEVSFKMSAMIQTIEPLLRSEPLP